MSFKNISIININTFNQPTLVNSTIDFPNSTKIKTSNIKTQIDAYPSNTIKYSFGSNTDKKWVAGGQGTNTLAYSAVIGSGVQTWTGIGTGIFSTQCNSIAWNGLIFVAGGAGTNTLAYSTNGTSWVGLGSTIFTTSCRSITWNGQM